MYVKMSSYGKNVFEILWEWFRNLKELWMLMTERWRYLVKHWVIYKAFNENIKMAMFLKNGGNLENILKSVEHIWYERDKDVEMGKHIIYFIICTVCYYVC